MRALGRGAPRLAGGLLALGAAAGTIAVARGSGRYTTFTGSSHLGLVLTIAAGAGLAAAAVGVAFGRGSLRIADLALLAGLTWFAPIAVAWREGPAVVRSAAAVASLLAFPVLVHLVLAYPGGRLEATPRRALAFAAYLEAGLVGTLLALFRAPYLDPSCWANCSVNSFLLTARPRFVQRIETLDRWVVASLAIALALDCAVRLTRASATGRRRILFVAGPAILFAAAITAQSIALQSLSVDDPTRSSLQAIFAARAGAVTLIALGIGLGVARAYAERRAVGRVVASLDAAPAPGRLQAALAEALADPDLRIGYRHAGTDGFINADGKPFEELRPGAQLTTLSRRGRTIAVISRAGGEDDVEAQLGPSLLLGLENERLQAEVLAQLAELRASRGRIVEAADGQRRRLEHDLHDGAQQQLIALIYELRLAHNAPGADVPRLAHALEQAEAALDELRALAHGIYPVILDEAGLGAAIATLADTAPIAVDASGADERRYTSAVETAAYAAVLDFVERAATAGATRVNVQVTPTGSELRITVTDDAEAIPAPSIEILDRVGALGGVLVTKDHVQRLEIPCV